MANLVGQYSLIFGLIVSIILIIHILYYIQDNQKIGTFKNFVSLLTVQFFFVITSFLSLIYLFLKSDFSNITVYNHSHTTKPLLYKISGVWGNHEGSLLLWLLVLTLFILIFIFKSKNLSNKYRLLTIFFQEIIILGFFLFIIITSNPFLILYPIPNEGLGLNPILQDPALAIHPPILYLGYVGSSIIFSASLAALVTKNINSIWAKHIKKWIFGSWIFLTLGIMLGSIWAYYELGWGGFWFWDPVENVSLMPWFCLTGLLHTIIILEKRQVLKSWTIILSIATFSLSMCGTFLVRSGILNSIHTFANDPSRGLFILLFLFSLIILAIIIFLIYSEKENFIEKKFFWLSKDTAILVNNLFMMYFLSVVLIGTIYPIFLDVLYNHKISVGPPFYNKLIIPFLIIFLMIMSVGPNLKWIKDKTNKINFSQFIILVLSILIAYFIIKVSNVKYLFSTLLVTASFFLFFNSLKDTFKENITYSRKISHFAFSVLIVSILLNGLLSKEFSINMKVGDEVKFMDKSIKFKNINTYKENNYNSIEGTFEITDKRNNIITFNPQIRIYNQPFISTSEADIKTNFYTDNFLVFNLLKNDGYFNVRYQFKPLMIWIWISVIVLAFGGSISLLRNK